VGCGREMALGLARCVDAGVLRTAMCGNSLGGPLQQWWDAARNHLVDDPTGKLGRSHPALHAHSLTRSLIHTLSTSMHALLSLQLPSCPFSNPPHRLTLLHLPRLFNSFSAGNRRRLSALIARRSGLSWSCTKSSRTWLTILLQETRFVAILFRARIF
jgi:hypothetical protein